MLKFFHTDSNTKPLHRQKTNPSSMRYKSKAQNYNMKISRNKNYTLQTGDRGTTKDRIFNFLCNYGRLNHNGGTKQSEI